MGEKRGTESCLNGLALLREPLCNRGTAFSDAERRQRKLEGLLPPAQSSLEEQMAAAYQQVMTRSTDLEKWSALRDLALQNETLFFHLAQRHLTEVLPLLYTPTIGEVAQRFSSLWRPGRGLMLHPGLKGRLREVIAAAATEVEVVVATDGERVLGLGDQGLGGMAIAQGKICLYSLFGGFYPGATLPICLDVGTQNESLLADPCYLGWRHPRLVGAEYDDFLDEFVEALRSLFPGVLLQWEDFGKGQARRVLERYRHQILSFNDDIQGTAAVTLGGLLAALSVKGQTLLDQRIVIYGGGSAGLGIAERLMQFHERQGGHAQEIADRIFVLDRRGLLTDLHTHSEPLQQRLQKSRSVWGQWQPADPDHIGLQQVVQHVHPTILIGVSAHGGAFSEEVVKEMARHCERPIIFPLSNPTSRAEALPADLVRWTEGRCLVATGSPFSPVAYEARTFQIGQCNNLYIFPGLGMGCKIAGAREVTESMLERAAEIVAQHAPALQDPHLSLFPPLEKAPAIARQIAIAVAQQAQLEGVADRCSSEQLQMRLQQAIWEPSYLVAPSRPPCGK